MRIKLLEVIPTTYGYIGPIGEVVDLPGAYARRLIENDLAEAVSKVKATKAKAPKAEED
jgi:hypothetical protein